VQRYENIIDSQISKEIVSDNPYSIGYCIQDNQVIFEIFLYSLQKIFIYMNSLVKIYLCLLQKTDDKIKEY